MYQISLSNIKKNVEKWDLSLWINSSSKDTVMIDLNQRAQTLRVAKQSLEKKAISDKQRFDILLQLLKNLIKYQANKV